MVRNDSRPSWNLAIQVPLPGTYIAAGQYWDPPGSETGGFIGPGKYYNLGASVYYTVTRLTGKT